MGIYTRRNQIQQAANYRDWLAGFDAPAGLDVKKFRVASNQAIAANFNTNIAQIMSTVLNRITFEPQAVHGSLYIGPLLGIANHTYPGDAGDFTTQGLVDKAIADGAICLALAHGCNNIGRDVSCA